MRANALCCSRAWHSAARPPPRFTATSPGRARRPRSSRDSRPRTCLAISLDISRRRRCVRTLRREHSCHRRSSQSCRLGTPHTRRRHRCALPCSSCRPCSAGTCQRDSASSSDSCIRRSCTSWPRSSSEPELSALRMCWNTRGRMVNRISPHHTRCRWSAGCRQSTRSSDPRPPCRPIASRWRGSDSAPAWRSAFRSSHRYQKSRHMYRSARTLRERNQRSSRCTVRQPRREVGRREAERLAGDRASAPGRESYLERRTELTAPARSGPMTSPPPELRYHPFRIRNSPRPRQASLRGT